MSEFLKEPVINRFKQTSIQIDFFHESDQWFQWFSDRLQQVIIELKIEIKIKSKSIWNEF